MKVSYTAFPFKEQARNNRVKLNYNQDCITYVKYTITMYIKYAYKWQYQKKVVEGGGCDVFVYYGADYGGDLCKRLL